MTIIIYRLICLVQTLAVCPSQAFKMPQCQLRAIPGPSRLSQECSDNL